MQVVYLPINCLFVCLYWNNVGKMLCKPHLPCNKNDRLHYESDLQELAESDNLEKRAEANWNARQSKVKRFLFTLHSIHLNIYST